MAAQTGGAIRGSKKLTLAFGIVAIPIRYSPLTSSGKPISGKLHCPEHREKVDQFYRCGTGTDHEHLLKRGECVSAYPHPDDPSQLVIVDPAVLEEFAEERTGIAALESVVDVTTIDPIYFASSHLVDCEKENALAMAAFDTFCTVLRDGKKAAVTTTVMNKETRTVLFRWSEAVNCIVLHICEFHSRMRMGDVEMVSAMAERRTPPSDAEIAMGKQLFAALEGEFDPTEREDQWTPLMLDAIRQSANGQTVTVKKPEKEEPAQAAGSLLDALKASVEAAKTGSTKKPPAKKPAARKRTTKATS